MTLDEHTEQIKYMRWLASLKPGDTVAWSNNPRHGYRLLVVQDRNVIHIIMTTGEKFHHRTGKPEGCAFTQYRIQPAEMDQVRAINRRRDLRAWLVTLTAKPERVNEMSLETLEAMKSAFDETRKK